MLEPGLDSSRFRFLWYSYLVEDWPLLHVTYPHTLGRYRSKIRFSLVFPSPDGS